MKILYREIHVLYSLKYRLFSQFKAKDGIPTVNSVYILVLQGGYF